MKKLVLILTSITFIVSFQISADESKPSPELVVHLLDYLAKDYAGAVQNGKVVSEFEYKEQVEFASIVGKNSQNVERSSIHYR